MARRCVGLIGVGNLGLELGRRLKSAYEVCAFDLNASRVSLLGCEAATSVTDVVRRIASKDTRPTVVSIVPNDEALRSVSDEVVMTLGEGGLHISCATVSPRASREVAVAHENRGVNFVAAPIFARPENMRSNAASFILSGKEREAAANILACAAPPERLFLFGDDPGAANVVKLCGNFLIAATIQSLAEGLAMTEANGVDRCAVMDVLSSTIFDCAIYKGYGRRVSRRDHAPGGFALEHGLKDITLILDTAHRAGQPMPFGAVLRDRFLAAVALGRADLDWSAVALQTTRDGGVEDERSPADFDDAARAAPGTLDSEHLGCDPTR
ncbi:hypothetical protein CTAYLR_004789 [Chrysophaeum taylorii]|uniref:NAD(P)-dependent oxidoreductase n=1 Tax=Chrysophaeum taylorii TaxID=2483200 RepID=A0AAD7UMS9_9STRA|nr:hypothetical protein CTAYLR_004789 [Chrysophaeum taylorii]